MSDAQLYNVKVRLEGSGAFVFLTPTGGTTRLRVHAARYDRAGAFAMEKAIVEDNPGRVAAAKVVPA